jgi:large subunit ribosomal protein L6
MFKPIKDRLILEGVGFKVWKKKQCLKLKLGYSAPVFLKIPSGIKISLYKQRKISISGLCTQYVRIFKHKLCSLKIPDAYKKKGIRIWGEVLKFKVGKKTR